MVPKEYRNFVDKVKESLGLPEEIEEAWGGMTLGLGGTHNFQSTQLDAALNAKPAFIACGLGITRQVVEQCHAAGIQVFSLVGNVKNARRNAAIGVDFIIAQGTEAGGHTGRIGTMALVPQVVDAVKPIPVLAAGGIADGRGLVAALALGAVGVWTGTMWLTCHETPAPDSIKDRMIESTDEDFVITKIYTGKTARFLKNKYIERWQQPDAPQTLPMPLQNLYSPMPLGLSTENPGLLSLFSKPEVADWVSIPAGNASPLIKQRRSARQMVYDMVSEAIDILGSE
jgi:nitronate monooxygenase